MLRVFTKDIGRFKRGEQRDYSKNIWTQIAASARKPLNSFTSTVDDLAKKGIKT